MPNKYKESRRRLTKAEVDQIKKKNTVEKINKTKSFPFEKVNKIDKTVTRLIKVKNRKFKLPISGMKKGTSLQILEILLLLLIIIRGKL